MSAAGTPGEPVHLLEDAETGDRFLIYGTDKGVRIELRYEGEMLWLNQTHYNLDAIISVGYRVNTKEGTLFRKWATDTLVRFATKGFVVDVSRLKKADAQDRIAELRDIIRDIRADEANVYRELRRICSMCKDYDAKLPEWHLFYAKTQARLMWAVTSNTPSEIVVSRANADDIDGRRSNKNRACKETRCGTIRYF